MKRIGTLWLAIAVLIVLSPLGLILPAKLGAGSAWGEWSANQLKALVGYAPRGLARLAGIWRAPLPDYAPAGQEKASLGRLSLSYVLSGVLGVVVVVAVTFLLGKALTRRGDADAP